MRARSIVALFACMLLSPVQALAQTTTVRTQLEGLADRQIGFQYRDAVNQAVAAMTQGDTQRARELLQPVIAFCDRLSQDGREIVSVSQASEYETYVDSAGKGVPVDWIDRACPGAYNVMAFLDIEAKDSDSALRFLDKTSELAPYLAEPLAERGYLLNRLGKPQEALDSYRRALDLVERFESNRYAKAMVLRGIGYTYVELQDLDRAEQAYRDSLQVEPDNALALRELEYISKQRASE